MCVDNCTKNGMECDKNRIMCVKIGTSVIKIAQMRGGFDGAEFRYEIRVS